LSGLSLRAQFGLWHLEPFRAGLHGDAFKLADDGTGIHRRVGALRLQARQFFLRDAVEIPERLRNAHPGNEVRRNGGGADAVVVVQFLRRNRFVHLHHIGKLDESPAAAQIKIGNHIGRIDTFKTLHDAPEKAAGQWSALTQSLRLSNAELELTNAKLEQDISKLEGKPHNGLTVMLEEARVAALNLGAQLDKDIQGMYKLFKEQDAGFFGRLFGGADNRELEKLLGGETSYGGLNAQLCKVNEDEDRQL